MKRTIVNSVFKDTVTFIKTSAETNGQFTEAELTLRPGGKNPAHYHLTYSETFTAIEGELGVGLAKRRKKILKPGETYSVDPKNLHFFFNPNDREIKFKVVLKPGHEGFENSLRILYGLTEDLLVNKKGIPKSLQHTAIILCLSDMNLPGFFTLISPLLKRIAKKAKDSGVEQQLTDRYCS
jgi:quercetin dioxygenase-like cupin family protein